MDLVSIIIPAYNVAAYIDRCVESVCLQTYDNIEIILVDDGSTDGITSGKCDDWASKDGRIKTVHKANGGLSDARNAGLDIASGEYIYFLDADDYIRPELVETVLKQFDELTDMVCFSFLAVDENNMSVYTPHPQMGFFHFSTCKENVDFILGTLLVHKIGWEAWNKMFRRCLIEKYHLRFVDNNRIFAEDQYFSICYCLHAASVKSIPDRLYYYIQRSDSIMGKCRFKNNIDRISLLSEAVFEHMLTNDDCAWALERFSLLHYMIIRNEFAVMEHKRGMNRREIRKVIINTVKNKEFFFQQLRGIYGFKKELYTLIGGIDAERELVNVRFYLDNHYFMSRVRNRLITWVTPIILRNDPHEIALTNEYTTFCSNGNKRIYLIGTEEFGNLGDHQISESILEFLAARVDDYCVKEITILDYNRHKQKLKEFICPDDIILMTGGGNFGDTYPLAERLRQDVIATWPENKKIVFPQTIFYSDTPEGREMLRKGQQIYTAENHLTIFARDRRSYEFARKYFTCLVYECPDVVLFSNKCCADARKKQILLCMRQDIEKALDQKEQERLAKFLETTDYTIQFTDTQLDYHIKKCDRVKKLNEYFKRWQESRLVITDRLHGMVFAAITGTPCVAFDNFNGKVRGTYAWIKYLPYIEYAENVDHALAIIPKLLDKRQNSVYSNAPLVDYYSTIESCIRGEE